MSEVLGQSGPALPAPNVRSVPNCGHWALGSKATQTPIFRHTILGRQLDHGLSHGGGENLSSMKSIKALTLAGGLRSKRCTAYTPPKSTVG